MAWWPLPRVDRFRGAIQVQTTAGLSAGMGEEVKGTVTKIDGGKVSIKDHMGYEKTIEPTNPEVLTGLKVGDRASVKDGILKIESGAGPTTPSPGPRY